MYLQIAFFQKVSFIPAETFPDQMLNILGAQNKLCLTIASKKREIRQNKNGLQLDNIKGTALQTFDQNLFKGGRNKATDMIGLAIYSRADIRLLG